MNFSVEFVYALTATFELDDVDVGRVCLPAGVAFFVIEVRSGVIASIRGRVDVALAELIVLRGEWDRYVVGVCLGTKFLKR